MPRAARFDEDDDIEDPLEDLDDEEDEDDIDEDEAEDEAREFYQEHARPLTPADTVEILAAAATVSPPRYQLAGSWEMTCRVCGCSDSRACEGGCVWAAPNLCSRCVA